MSSSLSFRYVVNVDSERRIQRIQRRRKVIDSVTWTSWTWVARRLFVVSLIIAISTTTTTTTTTLISSSVSKKKIGGGSLLFLSCDAFVVIPQRQQRIIPRRRNGNKYYDNIREIPIKINTTPICLSMKTQTSRDSSSTGIITGTGNTNSTTADGSSTTIIVGADYDNRQDDSKIVGAILAVGIILSLAGLSIKGLGVGGIGNANEVTSSSVAAMTNVVDTVIPSTSTDLLAVTLGESIGGVIGAIFSVAINFILRGGKTKTEDDESSSSDDNSSYSNNNNINVVDIDDDDKKSSLLSQGISDSDYFIANSASYALFEAVGVPESIAKLSSIFVAAIPSQLVKVGATMSKQKRDKENQLMLQLLREEQKKKQKRNFPFSLPLSSSKKSIVNPKELKPVTAAMAMPGETSITTGATETTAAAAAVTAIDFVEVFADITRWLEYDVLKTEYGETALTQLWNGQHPPTNINAFESSIVYALLGSLAAVSSRWYADVLYGRFCYGPVEKQKEVRTRSEAEWFSLYSSTAASAAVLFGCYEFFQLPIGFWIEGTLAGGVEGCVGSNSFDVCLQTYINTNSPGPTSEAQIRALVTNLYAVWVRLQDIAVDTSADDISALVRAYYVSINSFVSHYL